MKKLSGFIFVLFLACLIRYGHSHIPTDLRGVIGEAIIGVGLGLILKNFFISDKLAQNLNAGIKLCYGNLLKASIIMLGVQISLKQVISLGGKTLLLVSFTMGLSLFLAKFLGEKLGVPKKLAALIGIGASVCGNTAISATGPAIKASDEEISFAIATNTLIGTCAVFLFPIIGNWLGLSDQYFGMWSGIAVNDTSQVVATGFSFSQAAGEMATTVKLTRNSLMGVVILLMSSIFVEKKTINTEVISSTSIFQKLKIPSFVIAFLFIVILNSLGFIHWIDEQLPIDLLIYIKFLIKFFILMALIGVGLNTKFHSMKQIGLMPIILGLTISITVSTFSFIAISFL